jgi:cell division protein FtsL
MTEQPYAKVSLEKVYEVVLDVQGRTIRIEQQISDLSKDRDDHEARIKALERKIWVMSGLALAGGAGLSELWSALSI